MCLRFEKLLEKSPNMFPEYVREEYIKKEISVMKCMSIIYIVCLVASVVAFTLHTSINKITTQVSVENPTFDEYILLNSSNSFKCDCTEVSISPESFLYFNFESNPFVEDIVAFKSRMDAYSVNGTGVALTTAEPVDDFGLDIPSLMAVMITIAGNLASMSQVCVTYSDVLKSIEQKTKSNRIISPNIIDEATLSTILLQNVKNDVSLISSVVRTSFEITRLWASVNIPKLETRDGSLDFVSSNHKIHLDNTCAADSSCDLNWNCCDLLDPFMSRDLEEMLSTVRSWWQEKHLMGFIGDTSYLDEAIELATFCCDNFNTSCNVICPQDPDSDRNTFETLQCVYDLAVSEWNDVTFCFLADMMGRVRSQYLQRSPNPKPKHLSELMNDTLRFSPPNLTLDFPSYFETCNPSKCTYIKISTPSVLTIIGAVGGFYSVASRMLLIFFSFFIKKWKLHKKKTSHSKVVNGSSFDT